MKSPLLIALALAAPAAQANDAEERLAGERIVASMSAEARQLCVFDNLPPSDLAFSVSKALKVAKGSYGGVKELLPELARQALAVQADAIVDYNSSQRFGFWPWRLVRPVVTGRAIRWTAPPSRSCTAMGGVLLETILLTNRSPEALAAAGAVAPPTSAASAP